MSFISVVTPCYNEELNVREIHAQVREVIRGIPEITRYEHIFIDNASRDRTPELLRELAAEDPNVKVIFNTRNFGHIRSPYHGLLQSRGDAAILIVCDLQDPPSMIRDFFYKWKEGYRVVLGVKEQSDESPAMFLVRKLYYDLIARIADVELTKNNTGFGLYDKVVIDSLRRLNDSYPYFRGLIAELGFESCKIPYKQPARKRGITKNNFYTLYDMAMLGVTTHSRVPLRLATMFGFALSFFSLLVALGYLVAKLVFWDEFALGLAPAVIGIFLFSSIQLFFIGLIGEYLGFVYTQVLKRPLVVERERINFDE